MNRPEPGHGPLPACADEHAIVRVLHLYCRGIDRIDVAALEAVYHPDAIDDHYSFQGKATDFIPWVTKRLSERYVATRHLLTNTFISFSDADPDLVMAESYVTAVMMLRPELGGGQGVFAGRYIDKFARRHGEWRIAHRKLAHDWSTVRAPDGSITQTVATPEEDGAVAGRRDSLDLSYFGW